MTIQEILDELERITDSLSDVDNRWGIEGVVNEEISKLNKKQNIQSKELAYLLVKSLNVIKRGY